MKVECVMVSFEYVMVECLIGVGGGIIGEGGV